MVAQRNIDVPPRYNLCQLCCNITQLYFYRGISSPGHRKEAVDGINAIDKRYIYQLMYNVQLPGSKTFDSHIIMYYITKNNDVSLVK